MSTQTYKFAGVFGGTRTLTILRPVDISDWSFSKKMEWARTRAGAAVDRARAENKFLVFDCKKDHVEVVSEYQHGSAFITKEGDQLRCKSSSHSYLARITSGCGVMVVVADVFDHPETSDGYIEGVLGYIIRFTLFRERMEREDRA